MHINVVPNGKGHKVLVDGGMNGCHEYGSKEIANRQAVILKEKHYPHAQLHLAQ
jgi:hypothetical protein